jgi:phosphoribosylformimino-5-aminoimidazole carboxamide ribotide isomerase
MNIYPAIDILDGKCVRLYQGRLESVKIYYENPLDSARNFEEAGASWVHVVDLNGAALGQPKNWQPLEKIVKKTSLKVQFGGGVRDLLVLERLFELGVERVVLGTTLITAPEFVAEACLKYPKKIVAAIDAEGGKVAIRGWRDGTKYDANDVVQELKELGIDYFLYTDIALDGTLRGVNFEAVRQVAQAAEAAMIVSGGVSSLDDVKCLKAMESLGIEGVIIGTALYEGKIDLKKALEVA